MASQLEDDKISELIQAAVKAKDHAYCPYSKFRVGAAVMSLNETIFTAFFKSFFPGTVNCFFCCNVENCSYGVSICAERTALVKAVSDGCRKFKAIAITSDLENEISPCGSCRQFMIEFGKDWEVYLTRSDLTYKKLKVSDLLPLGFTPADLNDTKA